MQLHLPLAPLQNSGYGLKTTPQHAKALHSLAATRKHSRCLLRRLFGHQQRCALRRAVCTSFMQRHRAKNALALKQAQITPSIIDCTAPPAAASKPPTTVRNDCIVEGKRLTRQAPKPRRIPELGVLWRRPREYCLLCATSHQHWPGVLPSRSSQIALQGTVQFFWWQPPLKESPTHA